MISKPKARSGFEGSYSGGGALQLSCVILL